MERDNVMCTRCPARPVCGRANTPGGRGCKQVQELRGRDPVEHGETGQGG